MEDEAVSYEEATSSEEGEKWKKAIAQEISALEEFVTWIYTRRQISAKLWTASRFSKGRQTKKEM